MCVYLFAGATSINPNWSSERTLARLFGSSGARCIVRARADGCFWWTVPEFTAWLSQQQSDGVSEGRCGGRIACGRVPMMH